MREVGGCCFRMPSVTTTMVGGPEWPLGLRVVLATNIHVYFADSKVSYLGAREKGRNKWIVVAEWLTVWLWIRPVVKGHARETPRSDSSAAVSGYEQLRDYINPPSLLKSLA
jgi:hypothetical protein